MTYPLYIAFVWHMHQPYYKASRTGEFVMPWVRLHALKDYLDMVDMLDPFPNLHQTFNLVPSLIEQLEEYASGKFSETYWDHTLKPAEELNSAERSFVVDLMCERSWHPRAQRYPRYLELAQKKEATLDLGIDRCASGFSTGELRDLQVWFNLAWFDPLYLDQDPLAGLVRKGRDFSEADKDVLAGVQTEILAKTLGVYRQAAEEGRIEITTSPYFHPILPLLVNTDLARIARGGIALPPRRFAHAEDAVEQVERGLRKHKETFGQSPRGMWCSEMSLGEDIIVPLADHGIRWTIGDEEHLARSLNRPITRSEAGHVQEPETLYRPYLLQREGRELAIVFRDHSMSDLIGFTYQSWAPHDAAANLIWRLREIRSRLAGSREPNLVTIALDGENAWEYYSRDGRDFLRHLYEGLEGDRGFACVTVSEFLEKHPAQRELPWLHTGSWIYGDFSTWIGDPAHSKAWELLHGARDTVAQRRALASPTRLPALEAAEGARAAAVAPETAAVEDAWHHVLVAEGSDWFWWFGEHQGSDIDHLWDLNFRLHLQEAYRLLGERPPLGLFAPILTGVGPERRDPAAHLTPRIDGLVSSPDEWEQAGLCRAARGGTMQRARSAVLEEVRYGSDEHNLYLLLLPGEEHLLPGTELAVYLSGPVLESLTGGTDAETAPAVHHTRFWGRSLAEGGLGFDVAREIMIRVGSPGEAQATLSKVEGGEWGPESRIREVAYRDVVELAVPLEDLGLAEPARFDFVVGAAREGVLLELCPQRGVMSFDLASVTVGRGRLE